MCSSFRHQMQCCLQRQFTRFSNVASNLYAYSDICMQILPVRNVQARKKCVVCHGRISVVLSQLECKHSWGEMLTRGLYLDYMHHMLFIVVIYVAFFVGACQKSTICQLGRFAVNCLHFLICLSWEDVGHLVVLTLSWSRTLDCALSVLNVWFVFSLTHSWPVYFWIILHCRFEFFSTSNHSVKHDCSSHLCLCFFFNTWPTYLNITTNLLHPTMPALKAISCTAIFSPSHISKPFCGILHRFKNAYRL